MPLLLDQEGFLKRLEDWDESVARELAANHDIELTPEHWEIVTLVRRYNEQYGIFPANRVLVGKIREELGETKGTSIHLMQLFTGKPRRFIAMIAGLPKPTNCD